VTLPGTTFEGIAMSIRALPHVAALSAYAGPPPDRIVSSDILLDSNECTVGPSASVIDALQEALSNPRVIRCYPEYGDLSALIGGYAQLPPEYVLPTNGSDQAIDIIFRCFTEKHDEVIIPSPTFATFGQSAALQGCSVLTPLYTREGGYPVEEVKQLISPRTRLITVCNPNNPTGTVVSAETILNLAEAAPHAAILVDECYFEFSGITVAEYLPHYQNMVVTRTMSKTWSLAGLRVGYILSNPDNIAELTKIRGPYDVNALAAVAACAALHDPLPMQRYASEVASVSRPLLCSFLQERKITYWHSGANFILVEPPEPERCAQVLREMGIRVRARSGPHIEGTIRISLGTGADTERLIDAMTEFLDGLTVDQEIL
jgi:histidinol-phosphate aminotransferase